MLIQIQYHSRSISPLHTVPRLNDAFMSQLCQHDDHVFLKNFSYFTT